jgi:hypothetical protein
MMGSFFKSFAEASMTPNEDKKCTNCKKHCPNDRFCSRKCLGEHVSRFKWTTVFEDGTAIEGFHSLNPYLVTDEVTYP